MKMTFDISTLTSLERNSFESIAKQLAVYGLGISVPHMHTPAGKIVPLPNEFISLEQDLAVTFQLKDRTPNSMIPVGWRWTDDGLSVWAGCCGDGGGEGDGDGDGGR